MCRLAAFPPMTPSKVALDVVDAFECGNKDGFGYGYLRGNHFVAHKYPTSFSEVLRSGQRVFDHMPHKGWTIAHVRLATHGKPKEENTHPFIRGDYMTAHNGVWSDSTEARKWLEMFVKFKGETDSEVASYLIHRMTPKKWWDTLYTGVYLSLERNGDLHLAKGWGDAAIYYAKWGNIIASEFPKKWNSKSLSSNSYHKWGKDGKLKDSQERQTSYVSGYRGDDRSSSNHSMLRRGDFLEQDDCGMLANAGNSGCNLPQHMKDYIKDKVSEVTEQRGLWDMRQGD